jgi:hypothetical protein
LYELLLTSRRYHHSGDAREAVTVAFGVVFLAVDLLLMFIPGPKLKTGTLARPGLRSMGAGLHRLQRSSLLESGQIADRLRPSSTVTLLKPLERFRVQGTPSDAIALKGVGERGLYVKSGEFFVAGDTHHYPVYRRADETFFRLKNKDAPGQDEWILTLHESREWLLGADAPMAGPSSGVLTPWRAPLEQVDWRPPAVRSVTQDRFVGPPCRPSTGSTGASKASGTRRRGLRCPGYSMCIWSRRGSPTMSFTWAPGPTSRHPRQVGITDCCTRASRHR